MMNTNANYIRDFLTHMGIQADVQLDGSNDKLIIIANDEYDRRRNMIETWFTLVEQDSEYSYFRERLRGTGQTA
jgi:hypothetical protein